MRTILDEEDVKLGRCVTHCARRDNIEIQLTGADFVLHLKVRFSELFGLMSCLIVTKFNQFVVSWRI